MAPDEKKDNSDKDQRKHLKRKLSDGVSDSMNKNVATHRRRVLHPSHGYQLLIVTLLTQLSKSIHTLPLRRHWVAH